MAHAEDSLNLSLASSLQQHGQQHSSEGSSEDGRQTLKLTLTQTLDTSKFLRAQLTRPAYDSMIMAARHGQLDKAIAQLQNWHVVYPEDNRIVYDMAALLDSAGDYANALKFDRQILNDNSPAYAIKAIAHAARMSSRADEAESAYRLVLAKNPNDNEAHAGLAYSWMAQGRMQDALAYVQSHLPANTMSYKHDDVPLLVAQAEMDERRQQWLQAAATYQQVLRFEPDFGYAIRGRVLALLNADMPFLARRLASRHPQLFSRDEQFHLENDAVAQTIRFGEAQSSVEHGGARYASTDAALTSNARVLAQFDDRSAAQFDRLVALRDRARMREAVQLYESLHAAGIAVPPYAKFAGADAYLSLHQPEQARALYVDGLKEVHTDKGENFNVQASLMYAYQEAEQQDEAMKVADSLLAHTPKINYQGIRGIEEPNPQYGQAQLLKAILDMYNDHLSEAEKSMRALREKAPFNSNVRAAWASLLSARDHPHAALDELTMQQVDEPESIETAASRADLMLSLNRFSEARAESVRLSAMQPESQGVQNLARKIDNYGSPSFSMDAVVGHGGGEASAESLYSAALYSAPLTSSLGDRYRVLSRLMRASGQTREGETELRTRLDAGFDYRYSGTTMEGMLTQMMNAAGTGLALSANRDWSDNWRTRVAFDTNVIDLPAAAMRDGIRARSLTLGSTWSMSESRQISGALSRMEFSDGNDRNAIDLSWKERWYANVKYKLDTIMSYATSGNNLGGRDYFNPSRDRELSLSMKNEWLTWRRYQRSFKQRAIVTAGQYWQDGFATGTLADMHLEQEWSRDDVLGVQYGIGRSFHPYDGNRDYRSYFYLTVFGRIQ
jgi:biofilm PGA synthesis protein PgaA